MKFNFGYLIPLLFTLALANDDTEYEKGDYFEGTGIECSAVKKCPDLPNGEKQCCSGEGKCGITTEFCGQLCQSGPCIKVSDEDTVVDDPVICFNLWREGECLKDVCSCKNGGDCVNGKCTTNPGVSSDDSTIDNGSSPEPDTNSTVIEPSATTNTTTESTITGVSNSTTEFNKTDNMQDSENGSSSTNEIVN